MLITVLWYIVGVLALFVAWTLLRSLTSLLVPEKVSGTALLKKELRKRGVPYAHLPPEFFDECVEWSIRLLDSPVRKTGFERKAELVRSLEGFASLVALWRTSPDDSTFSAQGGRANRYVALLEKYPLREGTTTSTPSVRVNQRAFDS